VTKHDSCHRDDEENKLFRESWGVQAPHPQRFMGNMGQPRLCLPRQLCLRGGILSRLRTGSSKKPEQTLESADGTTARLGLDLRSHFFNHFLSRSREKGGERFPKQSRKETNIRFSDWDHGAGSVVSLAYARPVRNLRCNDPTRVPHEVNPRGRGQQVLAAGKRAGFSQSRL
jgi:hypothetical protein